MWRILSCKLSTAQMFVACKISRWFRTLIWFYLHFLLRLIPYLFLTSNRTSSTTWAFFSFASKQVFRYLCLSQTSDQTHRLLPLHLLRCLINSYSYHFWHLHLNLFCQLIIVGTLDHHVHQVEVMIVRPFLYSIV